MYRCRFSTDFGCMAFEATDAGISRVTVPCNKNRVGGKSVSGPHPKYLGQLQSDLRKYFSGGEVDFRGYPLDLSGGSRFQRAVWAAVRRIPYGKTLTYAQVAHVLGKPEAARAVGGALKANPLPVLVPCHRVVASDGLGGFSLGVRLKERMLRMEGAI